jgi:hypothetical protein
MPSFRKLSAAQIAALHQPSPSERAHRIREYDVYLAEFVAGDYGRAELAAGDRRTLVRSRLQAAARRRGLVLRFRPGPNPALIFHVETAPPPVVKSALTPVAEGNQQRPTVPRRGPVPSRPPRRRQTATERYHEVLPRWMRDGQQPGRRVVNKRRRR